MRSSVLLHKTEELESTLAEWKDAAKLAEQKNKTAVIEVANLKQQLQEMERANVIALKALEEQNSADEAALASMKSQLLSLKEDVSLESTRQQLEELQQENKNLSQLVAVGNAEVEALRTQLGTRNI